MKKSLTYLALSLTLIATPLFADQVTINNNMQQPSTAQNNNNNNCGAPQANPGLRPGTYTRDNGNGSSDTIYTTGDKQPYMVDNNCNNNNNVSSAPITPYIFPGPYQNGGGNRGGMGGGGRR